MKYKIITTKQDALDCGMTHEATLWGVPIWYDDKGQDGAVFNIAPKFLPSILWIKLVDSLFEIFLMFVPEDKEFDLFKNIKPIK